MHFSCSGTSSFLSGAPATQPGSDAHAAPSPQNSALLCAQVSGGEGPAAGGAGAEATGGGEEGRRVREGAWRAAGPGPSHEESGAGADSVRAGPRGGEQERAWCQACPLDLCVYQLISFGQPPLLLSPCHT